MFSADFVLPIRFQVAAQLLASNSEVFSMQPELWDYAYYTCASVPALKKFTT